MYEVLGMEHSLAVGVKCRLFIRLEGTHYLSQYLQCSTKSLHSIHLSFPQYHYYNSKLRRYELAVLEIHESSSNLTQ